MPANGSGECGRPGPDARFHAPVRRARGPGPARKVVFTAIFLASDAVRSISGVSLDVALSSNANPTA